MALHEVGGVGFWRRQSSMESEEMIEMTSIRGGAGRKPVMVKPLIKLCDEEGMKCIDDE